ncbi:predicted protein [Botrytis cinerea T4]|uniref:Uncharacterized protein n=1 Tax=Botryotinia fuckeliana (strain T4) TaxID=999810 RepID=G2XZD0_BOTF4|nr:predicted protein [Botrytis cinerea T4]
MALFGSVPVLSSKVGDSQGTTSTTIYALVDIDVFIHTFNLLISRSSCVVSLHKCAFL